MNLLETQNLVPAQIPWYGIPFLLAVQVTHTQDTLSGN